MKSTVLKLAVVAGLLNAKATYAASVSVGYSLLATTAVPTMPQTMLYGLIVLIGSLAILYLSRRNSGDQIFNLILTGGLIASTAWLSGISEEVNALPFPPVNFSSGNPIVVSSLGGGDEVELSNDTGKAARVDSVSVSALSNLTDPTNSPRCNVGLIVPAGESCYIKIAVPLG